MHFPLIGPFHACFATIGLLSGSLAIVLRKGSGLHRAAGTIFFGSMLIMAASGVYMAALQGHTLNAMTSSLTAYLVTTGWLTGRRREATTSRVDIGALLFVGAVGATLILHGFDAASGPTRAKDGYPAAMYFIFGAVALLFAMGDVRMLMRGGVSGARRIARHLLRMCVALFFAFMSLYPGQARLFPDWIRESNVMVAPPFLVLALMIFWLVRVRRTNQQKKTAPATMSNTGLHPSRT